MGACVYVYILCALQFVHLTSTVQAAQTAVVHIVFTRLLEVDRSVSVTERVSLDVRLDGLGTTVIEAGYNDITVLYYTL